MRHVISVKVQNQFGVLARISSMISARGFNIDSLTVGETEDPKVSRMTFVVHGDDAVVDQIIKQLARVIETLEVKDLTLGNYVESELLFIKVKAVEGRRLEILQIANVFGAKIKDMTTSEILIELNGEPAKIQALIKNVAQFGIVEMARTGCVAMARSPVE